MLYFFIYLGAINIYALTLMYIDKHRSKKGKWRIPEARLFRTAMLLGSPGILLGMYLFRHKTKHYKFVFFIPIILIIQIIILYWLTLKLGH